ncbi:MAG: ATP synthase F1 subunit epsilon [Paracoccaceae bacterium]
MAETLTFELVSPSKRLAKFEAEAVTVPAVEGELTAMARHSPFLSALRPGVVTVVAEGKTTRYVVTSGFVEIGPESIGVVAEDAEEAERVDRGWLDARAEAARKAHDALESDDERKPGAMQHLHDTEALSQLLNL